MSNFQLLKREWPAVFEAASKAAETVHPDPRTACFYARRALELTVKTDVEEGEVDSEQVVMARFSVFV